MAADESENERTKSFVVLSAGTMVSHYRIVEKIGAGGMGEVYLAEDTKLNRSVALKFLSPLISNDPDVRVRFTREAQAAAKLDHPNIVTIYEVSEYEGRPFIAMQYIQGNTLQEIRSDTSIPVLKVLNLMIQIGEGLAKAHTAGIIHRDIKAANIIVDEEFRPKILDFGLASVQGGEMLTKVGSTLGTLAYMSPEQAQGKQVDQRSDLFSVGVVFYELLTGKSPFKRENDAATLYAVINDQPGVIESNRGEFPSDIQRIIAGCLEKDPAKRYQSTEDFITDLRGVADALVSELSGSISTPPDSKPSIAVLPFTNMSADPENEYFSDGLTEELLNVLAKSPELKVTGRTSSFAFKGKQEDLRGIGQKLGVKTLLEGSVRKSGNRIRITAQLVSAADGFHLWSETYDRVLEDVFAVQDDIAAEVAKAMHVTLLGATRQKQTVDPESYQLTLRATGLCRKLTDADVKESIELYEKALEIDPSNVRALAGMARAYLLKAAYGYGDSLSSYRRGKELAKKAIEMDDTIPEVHEVLGWVRAAFEFQFEEAEQAFRKAYDLAPNSPSTIGSLALISAIKGSLDYALSMGRKTLELDPLNPETYMNYGKMLVWSGRDVESERIFLKALELSPGMSTIHLSLGWAYLLQGRLDEALLEMEKEKATGYRYCGLAMVYHALGRHEESRKMLRSLIDEHGDEWSAQVATVYGYIGDNDKAFEWLEKAVASRDAGVPLTKISRFFGSLHDDPRWPAFLRKIGL